MQQFYSLGQYLLIFLNIDRTMSQFQGKCNGLVNLGSFPLIVAVFAETATECCYSGFGGNLLFPLTLYFLRHTNELRNFALTTQQRKFFICSFEYGLFLVLQDSWLVGCLRRNVLAGC